MDIEEPLYQKRFGSPKVLQRGGPGEDESDEEGELLVNLAGSGFKKNTRDDMTLLCDLELGVGDRVAGLPLHEIVLVATAEILHLDRGQAALHLESVLMEHAEEISDDLINCLNSEAAGDSLGKDDVKTVDKMMDHLRRRVSIVH